MSEQTRNIYAEVIGDPIAHSKSPLIHGFWLAKLGLDADMGFGYRAYQVAPDNLESYLAERRNDPLWRGCNVTMPHKLAIPQLVDQTDAIAGAIGASNTVYREGGNKEGGALHGTNTDAEGFLEPLRGVLAKQHHFRMARILGTGGAARAIVTALAGEGFTLVLAGRNPDKARAMLDELAPVTKANTLEHHAVPLDHFAEPTDFAFDDREGCLDLIINASPLGMRGQPELRFDWSHAPPGAIAYDIVTDPLDTPFLTQAKAAGHDTIDGYAMLIGQAARAFELFFGHAPPREHDADLRELLLA